MYPKPPHQLGDFFAAITRRPRIFVSYHHGGDAWYYAEFSRVFHDVYEAVEDRSLDRLVESNDSEYVIRRIRENCIEGTSCTIVLCGASTPLRKFVDWEIKATLDKKHALLGVQLPTNITGRVPDRFLDNWISRYAMWMQWGDLVRGPAYFKGVLESARQSPKLLIVNSRPLRSRNG